MLRAKWIFAAVAVLVALLPGRVVAGDYEDPTGFSFHYPEDWLLIPRPGARGVKDVLSADAKNWLAKNNIDFNQVSVLLIRESHDDFRENLNVVVVNQQMPINSDTLKQINDRLPREYGARGINVKDFRSRLDKIGGQDVVMADYVAKMPGSSVALRQKQIMLPGGGKTYMITCTATQDSFDRWWPSFERIVASFKVPAPAATAPGFDLNQLLVMGVFGAVAGGLATLFKKLWA